MSPPRPPRDRQRGNSLLLALIVMSSLATLGALTVVSVQSSLKASTNDRAQAIAMYAAESGGAAAMDFLRANRASDWTPYFTALPCPGNNVQPGAAGNAFSADQNAWYSVQLFNNRNEDTGGPPGSDVDKQVIIRATGHGPQGSVAIVEWEVKWQDQTPQQPMILIGWHVVL
jgi:Tfp pilus assembly protein PilX